MIKPENFDHLHLINLFTVPLTNFMPLASFYTPRKYRRFLMFSGGIERNQWHEMGEAK